MKFKLIKERVLGLSWYYPCNNKPNVLICGGFSESPDPHEIEVLPDIVEEFKPDGTIDFDDWDEELRPNLKDDFFFKSEKLAKKNQEKSWEVINKPHFVHVNRNWLEPLL